MISEILWAHFPEEGILDVVSLVKSIILEEEINSAVL